jgi:ketosteroid isomerase-like protein
VIGGPITLRGTDGWRKIAAVLSPHPVTKPTGENVMRISLTILALLLVLAGCATVNAAQGDEIRAVVERFVAAQNAHDLAGVSAVLWDSPDFLWITRGTAIWGREPALKRFEALYQGTWRLEPVMADLKIVSLGEGAAQIYMPIVFTIGAPGQPAQQTRFLMNQVLVKTAHGWKVSSILPIPAPAP